MSRLSQLLTHGSRQALLHSRELYRRLHVAFAVWRLADRMKDLDREIEVLQEQMAIDDQLAEINRRLYLKSPVLQARRLEDRYHMARLQARRMDLLVRMGALQ